MIVKLQCKLSTGWAEPTTAIENAILVVNTIPQYLEQATTSIENAIGYHWDCKYNTRFGISYHDCKFNTGSAEATNAIANAILSGHRLPLQYRGAKSEEACVHYGN